MDKANTCTLTPSTTQGPYYFDADKIRSDIRESRPGTRLELAIQVQDSELCTPVPNAVVELWHCDASGLYSGAEDLSRGAGQAPGGGGGDLEPQDANRYLRGAQVTDAFGRVTFVTIWPGWYRGRTVHIHAMVHIDDNRPLTTQIMFDEAVNAKVLGKAPYNQRRGRDTLNEDDGIFDPMMLMKTEPADDGYKGAIVFAIDSDKDGT
ncbi:intradiol ring-cleavage dioxygenase [Sinosporangium siamense]|uniref:Protocatechuate dioxygenase n=1 Tax=Sinosporangium siamense TaxID=1367973 RepID=A0A919REJ2_9ACTN|nr:intradiol ring-cleavage dioxygenase [Sinosporangium siamense]GII92242.1 protocatechuate dioxygenase [Sinosporangium siamense]